MGKQAMDIEILGEGAFESALVHIGPGERFVSESGAMYRASPNIDIDVTTRSKGSGGLLGGVKRLFAGESFFFSTYATTDGQPGEVGVAPTHQGELFLIDVDPATTWVCTGGSYLGSDANLQIETRFQGLKGFVSGESLSFVEVSGNGPLLVNAFGRLVETEVDQSLTIDTGHLVAFENTLQYTITKAGTSWLQSWLAGEGFVMNFTGQGRVLTQSHNPNGFGATLGALLPPRKS
jgi:uncharacterized protein (TIGR00266 family)